MSADIDKERAAFEAWADEKGLLAHARAARWAGWEARASLDATPSPAPIQQTQQDSCIPPSRAEPAGQHDASFEVLRIIGGQMSNVMFNLSQRNDGPNAKLYGELYREWDAAIRSVRTSPSEPAQ